MFFPVCLPETFVNSLQFATMNWIHRIIDMWDAKTFLNIKSWGIYSHTHISYPDKWLVMRNVIWMRCDWLTDHIEAPSLALLTC